MTTNNNQPALLKGGFNMKQFDFAAPIHSRSSRGASEKNYDVMVNIRIAGGSRRNGSSEISLGYFDDCVKQSFNKVAIGVNKTVKNMVIAVFNSNEMESYEIHDYTKPGARTAAIACSNKAMCMKIVQAFGHAIPDQPGSMLRMAFNMKQLDDKVYRMIPLYADYVSDDKQVSRIDYIDDGRGNYKPTSKQFKTIS